jgi:hypothetical protein
LVVILAAFALKDIVIPDSPNVKPAIAIDGQGFTAHSNYLEVTPDAEHPGRI